MTSTQTTSPQPVSETGTTEVAGAMSTKTMYDSASGTWPLRGNGAGGILLVYVDSWGGWWGGVHYSSNFLLAKARFPAAWLVQISVVDPGTPGVAVYDCEQGALTPEEVCGFANQELVHTRRVPTLYGSQSTKDQIVAELARHYNQWQLGRNIDYLLAHPGSPPVITDNNVGVQYAWNQPWHCDTSIVRANWQALHPVK